MMEYFTIRAEIERFGKKVIFAFNSLFLWIKPLTEDLVSWPVM